MLLDEDKDDDDRTTNTEGSGVLGGEKGGSGLSLVMSSVCCRPSSFSLLLRR